MINSEVEIHNLNKFANTFNGFSSLIYLQSALRSAGEVANMEMQGQQGMQGQEGMQGQQGMQASPSNFVTYINQSPPLWACFQNAFPDAQMLMQQGQQGGMTGGQTTGTTGDMAGQP